MTSKLGVSLLSSGSRHFSSSTVKNTIQNVTVVGGGLMGSGIAQVAAQRGNNVTILEVSSDQLKKAENIIQASLGRVAQKLYKGDPNAAKKWAEDTKSRIKGTIDIKDAVQNTDLVVEAVVENLELKHKIFKALDEAAPEKALFASNTSSLSIAEIASVVKRKDKFGGLHFFNPVPVMKLLEIIRIPETTDETYNAFLEWGKSIGKTCVTCKDTPGFIVNRLLVPYMGEAVRMLERGDATAQDIDTAMKLGAGHPMGPLELADYTGLDTGVFIVEGWHKKFPDESLFKPVELQNKLVAEGKLGRKSGEGFYKYDKYRISDDSDDLATPPLTVVLLLPSGQQEARLIGIPYNWKKQEHSIFSAPLYLEYPDYGTTCPPISSLPPPTSSPLNPVSIDSLFFPSRHPRYVRHVPSWTVNIDLIK